jgi:hypothetical protein
MRRGLLMRLIASSLPALALGLSAPAGADTQVSGPIAHANVAVYFLHGSAAEGAVPMSLEEALAKGRVKVSETGGRWRLGRRCVWRFFIIRETIRVPLWRHSMLWVRFIL